MFPYLFWAVAAYAAGAAIFYGVMMRTSHPEPEAMSTARASGIHYRKAAA